MNIIKSKKIHPKVLDVILFFSIAFGLWHYLRQLFAYISIVYLSGVMATIVANIFVAVLAGGLVGYLILSVLLKTTFTPFRGVGVAWSDLVYIFKFFIAIACLLMGGISFFYLLSPISSMYIDLVVRFIVFAAAVLCAFMYSVSSGIIRQNLIGWSLNRIGSSFCIAYAVIVLVKLLLFYSMGII